MAMNAQRAYREPVEAQDEMTAALEAGRLRAAEVYASGRNTLVDRINFADWLAWDASDEVALVSDPDGVDLPDHPECELAAA